jgi:hypothetical protein
MNGTVLLLFFIAFLFGTYSGWFFWGYFLGRRWIIHAFLVGILIFGMDYGAEVAVGVTPSLAAPGSESAIALFALISVSVGGVLVVGYYYGRKRRKNPPKPKEAPATVPVLSAFGRRVS